MQGTMLEVKCWECQQVLVRFHDVFALMQQWQQVTAMLPLPLPMGCYGCSFQHLGIILTQETAPTRYNKDYEGPYINEIYTPKE